MERNIVKALSFVDAEYIWLLADHCLISGSVNELALSLRAKKPSLAFVQITDYPVLFDLSNHCIRISQLKRNDLRDLLFYSGNLGSTIVSKSLLQLGLQYVDKFIEFSYPHLSIFSAIKQSSSLYISSLSIKFNVKRGRISDYDSFSARFYGMPMSLNHLDWINPFLLSHHLYGKRGSRLLRRDLYYYLFEISLDDPSILRKYPLRLMLKTVIFQPMPASFILMTFWLTSFRAKIILMFTARIILRWRRS